ncbi:AMP-binding protein [Candidatus Mycobacterium methanotrophicum]|uniref:AMP-binding protein n=1 Tax=Candidatus Mycobacterium methanotrophicum TaxID=2943498 RepID=UPI003513AEE2
MALLFLHRVDTSADREAFRYPDNEASGKWASVTWKQTALRVEALTAGLLALGVAAEDRIGIASTTRFEWILADLAIMCTGAATTTVYPSTNADDTAYILADSESRIVFAEDDTQLVQLKEHRNELPNLANVVVFEGAGDGDWVPGKPKGMRLRHEAWVYTGAAIRDMDLLGEDDVQLLWLPLAHSRPAS